LASFHKEKTFMGGVRPCKFLFFLVLDEKVDDRFKRAVREKCIISLEGNKAVVRRLFGAFDLGEKTGSRVPRMMDRERKDGTRILVPYVSAWCEA
jgi:hypothetical protein